MCGAPAWETGQGRREQSNHAEELTIPRDLSARLNLSTSLSLISNVTQGDCPSGTFSGRDWISGADEVCTTTLVSDFPAMVEKEIPRI